jgi:hypothetical protein
MKYVTNVQTNDGVMHKDVDAAIKHLDERFGKEITAMAHELCRLDAKYTKTVEWLSCNTHRFKTVIELAEEMRMHPTHDADLEHSE